MVNNVVLRLALPALLTFAVAPQKGAVSFRPYRHVVSTWIPPYAVAKSLTQLNASFGDAPMKDGLTHLDLQFWVPTPIGGVARAPFGEATDKAIEDVREWAHARGIRVMLCIYNGAKAWDWPLAKAAFADHRKDFVGNLVAEMDRWNLDGIDVDLEGPGTYDADKDSFLNFMTDLSKQVHDRHKHLTVDTFCYKWNAPNQDWWGALFPLVDAIASMGYEETGFAAPEWRSYAAQVKAAGPNARKLQLGMPTDRDQWQGNSALDQLKWVSNDGQAGFALWDAQLPSAAWRTPEVWRLLRDVNAAKR